MSYNEEKVKDSFGKVDKDIDRFLAYINGKTAKGQFTKDIAAEAERIKQHKETRLEYMTLMMELKEQRRECWEEGMKDGKKDMILEMLRSNQPISLIAQFSKFPIEKIAEIGKANGIAVNL